MGNRWYVINHRLSLIVFLNKYHRPGHWKKTANARNARAGMNGTLMTGARYTLRHVLIPIHQLTPSAMKLALCGDTGLSLALDQLDKKGIMANIIFTIVY